MSYRLFNRPGSGGFVVEAALSLADAPFELQEFESKPGTPMPESFRATNPWGQLPTLILPDGTTMTEAAAILIHLAAAFPDKGLGPAPGTSAHGQFLRWLVFASVNLYEAVLRRGYPFRYTTDPDGYAALGAAADARFKDGLTVLDAAVAPGPFLLGEQMSVADIYLAMLFTWFHGQIETPHLEAMKNGVKAHAVVGPIWRRHFGDR
ncbi:MAG: glutathione S-transferase family protein [Alphaproteobacteria bacterium]|jgi:glutathione S-transferase|nr:glutathione S-transferase family protein [Alphaproteobacteria bacterium]MDP6830923.1 glutathione S-transferase family protein [Alphaproteobacteria bacterium]